MVNAGEATLESVLAILEIEGCIEVAGDVIKDGHLVGCPKQADRPCRWCELAVVTPAVSEIVARWSDACRLTEEGNADLAWMVAAWSISRATVDWNSTTLRPEADLLVAQLATALRRSQTRLYGRILEEATQGGELVTVVTRVAAIRATAALAFDHERWGHYVSPELMNAVRKGSSGLSFPAFFEMTRFCSSKCVCAPGLRLDSDGRLAERLVTSASTADLDQRSNTCEPGSFEELTFEALRSEVINLVDACAEEIVNSTQRVIIVPSVSSSSYSEKTLLVRWANTSIDWTRTFLDLTDAPCWRVSEADGTWQVPWFVAADLEISRREGAISLLAS